MGRYSKEKIAQIQAEKESLKNHSLKISVNGARNGGWDNTKELLQKFLVGTYEDLRAKGKNATINTEKTEVTVPTGYGLKVWKVVQK